MWKREDAPRPAAPPATPDTPQAPPAPAAAVQPAATKAPGITERGTMSMGNIGKSVVIKGELSGSEDLTIEGQVEGKIELKENVLTIGTNGKIKAQVFAKTVIVLGEVVGNISASEKVDIRDHGSVDGDITSPKVAIAEGAHFRGAIDMNRGGNAKTSDGKPAAAATASSHAPPVPAGAKA
jgi:cytoskeletal protein CcmA (bactofilin family)